MTTLRIGIETYEQMKERTLAIAKGEYTPSSEDPNVWFPSIESFSRVLSDKNRGLLNAIKASSPQSITELAHVTGREKSNVSRTLKTMEKYGLVYLDKGEGGKTIPSVPFTDISLSLNLDPVTTRL